MDHERARELLDQMRHGIPACSTLETAIDLLRDALQLLEDDRRMLKEFHVNVVVGRVPRTESV